MRALAVTLTLLTIIWTPAFAAETPYDPMEAGMDAVTVTGAPETRRPRDGVDCSYQSLILGSLMSSQQLNEETRSREISLYWNYPGRQSDRSVHYRVAIQTKDSNGLVWLSKKLKQPHIKLTEDLESGSSDPFGDDVKNNFEGLKLADALSEKELTEGATLWISIFAMEGSGPEAKEVFKFGSLKQRLVRNFDIQMSGKLENLDIVSGFCKSNH